ncbi:MAG: hypothetical protein OXG81_16205 [Acidobacteria bacterium]|nr:hypothetical protein [Acidobacteriota bacterium]
MALHSTDHSAPIDAWRSGLDGSDPPVPMPCIVSFLPPHFRLHFRVGEGSLPSRDDPCGKAQRPDGSTRTALP